MIENLAIRTANLVKNMNPDETESHDILVFGFTLFYNLFITISLIFLVSIPLGKLSLALQVTIAFMLVRILTGGAHFDRSFVCTLSSLIFIIVALYLPSSPIFIYSVSITSFILIILFSPYYESHQLKHSKQWERKKKVTALLLIIIATLIYSIFGVHGFLTGVFLQSLLITPISVFLFHKLNDFICKGGGKVETTS